jgi:hypothetical protein
MAPQLSAPAGNRGGSSCCGACAAELWSRSYDSSGRPYVQSVAGAVERLNIRAKPSAASPPAKVDALQASYTLRRPCVIIKPHERADLRQNAVAGDRATDALILASTRLT